MEAHVSQGRTLSIVTRLHVKNLGIHWNYWLNQSSGICQLCLRSFLEFLVLFPNSSRAWNSLILRMSGLVGLKWRG
ncbi:uncharacterized protein LACBIDRAFT_310205 [Laccaria bicolor S238N-H82]|uniref:Predicted protein n=1 Tax=Laccaria bicolor (strain S238N-H82 / ATCC MYA-4686) TaxID=486041 RepID=B0DTP8_LACBS|nr:uncharacterized protein LACBIDRAFT_310205 [Laccaria bicolor S238N-H82]EDR01951.1 predicted protein [Laccaria bicolor S238N-H82]|eukprot:XP_001887342.1 predicted protein [Laccaria bicolor S238N-H82]